MTDARSGGRLTRHLPPPGRPPRRRVSPRARRGGYRSPQRAGAVPRANSRDRDRRSRRRTPVNVVGLVPARTVRGPFREGVGTFGATNEVTVLKVAVDAPGTPRAAGATPELAGLRGGEGAGVTEAHVGTPPVTDLFLVEYLLLRSDTLRLRSLWGRRDLNPRSTDISGAPRNSRGSSTRAMISRPLGISVWSVVPGASLWSQSPCLAWPQPHAVSHSMIAETRIKGFRSRAIEGRRDDAAPQRSSSLQSHS